MSQVVFTDFFGQKPLKCKKHSTFRVLSIPKIRSKLTDDQPLKETGFYCKSDGTME